ncbi:hypothetical protein ES707_19189 [subsurface metagenome]
MNIGKIITQFKGEIGVIIGTILGFFLNLYRDKRQEKKTRIRLFRALYNEIERNDLITQKMVKIKRSKTVFELGPLHSLSYQNIQLRGELFILPENLRKELKETYELIHAHNRQLPAVYEAIPRNRGFYERLRNITNKIEYLENELPRVLKFLSQKTS